MPAAAASADPQSRYYIKEGLVRAARSRGHPYH
jgi:hypothetical protein